LQVITIFKPVGVQIEVRKIFENTPDYDKGNDLVLLAYIKGNRLRQVINQQVYFINQNEGKRGINSGYWVFEEGRIKGKTLRQNIFEKNQYQMDQKTEYGYGNDDLLTSVFSLFRKEEMV
jgi:hypothetical protein